MIEMNLSYCSLGYTREYKVEGIGQFSIRGGIIDVYSPSMDNPCRIEFFDDEIDSIREFDVFTQKSLENLKKSSYLSCIFFYLS